ncbi:MAG: DUF4145 domain-containing protein [Candidatus Eremiobacteraeota bacterium]|nr:DUF4145 domain-containing protein [Candidatus Eremiobacteraeota bacterium]
MAGSKDEKFSRETIKCLHCQNRSRMPIVAEYDDVERGEDGYESGTYWELLRCSACDDVTLRKLVWHEQMEVEDSDWRPIYPSATSGSIEGLPAKIGRAWNAAQQVRRIDANAFAVLVRRVLDLVCEEQGAQGGSLARRLADLAAKGAIPGPLADIASNARTFGNIGAHADLGDLKQNEAALLDDLCTAVLEYVYAAPQLVTRAQAALTRLGKAPRAATGAPPEAATT